jgi:hypothetical protein
MEARNVTVYARWMVDKSQLELAIEQAKTFQQHKDYLTESSYNTLFNCIENAITVKNNESAEPNDVTSATNNLRTAQEGLKLNPEILSSLILTSVRPEKYETESYNTYSDASTAAQTFLNTQDFSFEKLNEMKTLETNLKAAIAGLKLTQQKNTTNTTPLYLGIIIAAAVLLFALLLIFHLSRRKKSNY